MLYQFDNRVTLNKDFLECPNVAVYLSERDRVKIGEMVFNGFVKDKFSREPWERRNEAGMDLAMQIQRDKNFPWQGASNIIFPLVTIASLQFGSRAYGNIINGTEVAQYRVIGEDPTGELTRRAERISRHMSWQCLEEDVAWEEQHDRLLINLAIVGCNFIKTYNSGKHGHTVSQLVMARDLVANYWSTSIEDAPRKTQILSLSRNDIYERVKQDSFSDVLSEKWFTSLPSGQNTSTENQGQIRHDNRQGIVEPQSDEDTPFKCLEQHRYLDLDGDGYAEPYICTIEQNSKALLRIVPRIEREEDIERATGYGTKGPITLIRPTEYYTKYSFIPAPDGGLYDLGFGTLLGPINESVNTAVNQIFDAGTMANSNGGFLGRGAKFKGGVYTMAPWEWKRVDATGDDLRKSLVPLPVREPSAVTFQLLGFMVQYADRLAGTVDAMVGENPGQNTKTGVYNETLQQGMEVYSQIFKRVWRCMKEEFKKRHRLNAVYLPERQRFGSKDAYILREDYKSDPDLVVPSADPHIISQNQKIQIASALRQAAHSVNGYNLVEVEKKWLRAIKVDSIDLYYPGPDKVPPLPNPKVAVENMRFQAKKMQVEAKRWDTVVKLQAAQRKTEAEITLLEAQAVSLLAGVQGEEQARRLEAFEVTINALKEHRQMFIDQIKALKEGSEDGTEGNSDRGGVGGMANQQGNQAAPGASPPMGGGAEGSMGGGSVPA